MVTVPVKTLLPKVTPLEPVPEIDLTVSVRTKVPPSTNPPVESLLVIVPEMVLLACDSSEVDHAPGAEVERLHGVTEAHDIARGRVAEAVNTPVPVVMLPRVAEPVATSLPKV